MNPKLKTYFKNLYYLNIIHLYHSFEEKILFLHKGPKNSLCQEKVNCEGSSLTFKVFGQKMTFKDQYHQYMDVKFIWPKKFKEIHQGAKSRELGFLKAW